MARHGESCAVPVFYPDGTHYNRKSAQNRGRKVFRKKSKKGLTKGGAYGNICKLSARAGQASEKPGKLLRNLKKVLDKEKFLW